MSFEKINKAVEISYLGGGPSPTSIPTGGTLTPVAIGPPNAPTGLTATAGNGQVSLAWNTVTGASYFNVYRNGQRVNLLPIEAFSYTDLALVKGALYSFSVTAVNSIGESTQSTSATATVVSAPLPPRNMSATVGILRVTLVWQAPPASNTANPPTSYNVYKGGSLLVAGLTALAYTDFAVSTNVTYPYVVTSVNAQGESVPTTSISVVPAADVAPGGPPPPAIPEVVGVRTTYTTGQITRVQELDSLGGSVTQADITWNANGSLKDVTEIDQVGTKHLNTLNYDVNGVLDPVNPMTRAVVP